MTVRKGKTGLLRAGKRSSPGAHAVHGNDDIVAWTGAAGSVAGLSFRVPVVPSEWTDIFKISPNK
jgi:hypothetical protein